MSSARSLVARLTGVVKDYHRGRETVHALRGVDLDLHAGELVALMGPSGSGKSTLLLVLGGWETPDAGELSLRLGSPRAAPWHDLAVIPQGLGLLDDLSVQENVALAARLAGDPSAAAYADELLQRLDIEALRDRRPGEISLGQQQRVAVARALVLQPAIVLADEPTTHQDAGNAAVIFAALRAAADGGAAVVIATHDPTGLHHADRLLTMSDGLLTGL